MATAESGTARSADIGDFRQAQSARRDAVLALSMSERLARLHAFCKQMGAIKGAASTR